jgi:hypothetical protein
MVLLFGSNLLKQHSIQQLALFSGKEPGGLLRFCYSQSLAPQKQALKYALENRSSPSVVEENSYLNFKN